MRRGPNVVVNGRELGTVALVYELDTDIGATFELLTVDQDALRKIANPLPGPAGPQAVAEASCTWPRPPDLGRGQPDPGQGLWTLAKTSLPDSDDWPRLARLWPRRWKG